MAELAHGRARLRVLFRQAVQWAGEHPLLCAAAFFVFAFALRLLCGRLAGPPTLCFAPDEWRYLHLARSIAEGGPLLIRGLPTDFQKILYPLALSPAFLLARNPAAQIKLVEVINCLAMASVVFPAALLAKKLSPRPAVLLLTLAFVCALPDFMYTATFMSEPLYWPLCLWVFYFFHTAMAEKKPRRRLALFALFGFFTYLAYCTREIGAAFLIAAAVLLVLEAIREKTWRQNAPALAACIAAFFVPFLIVKQALFAGMGNSYAGGQSGYRQLDPSALNATGAFGYLLFSTAALLAATVLSFTVLPVLLPLFRLRQLDVQKRRLYLFTALSLVVTAGAIAYTVYIREDLGDRVPRLHLRMLAPMVIPFVVLCFDLLLSKDGAKQKQERGRQSVLLLAAALCILAAVLLPVPPAKDEWFDHASLTASYLAELFSAHWIWPAGLLFLLALTAAGALCFVRGKKKAVLAMLLCAICTVSAADNIWQYCAVWQSRHIEEQVDPLFPAQRLYDPAHLAASACSVNAFLQKLEDAPDGRVMGCTRDGAWLAFETYASQRLPLRNLAPEHVLQGLEAGRREFLFDELSETEGWRVNYIIVLEDFNPFENAEVIYRQPPYLLLRNLDPSRLYLSEGVIVHG